MKGDDLVYFISPDKNNIVAFGLDSKEIIIPESYVIDLEKESTITENGTLLLLDVDRKNIIYKYEVYNIDNRKPIVKVTRNKEDNSVSIGKDPEIKAIFRLSDQINNPIETGYHSDNWLIPSKMNIKCLFIPEDKIRSRQSTYNNIDCLDIKEACISYMKKKASGVKDIEILKVFRNHDDTYHMEGRVYDSGIDLLKKIAMNYSVAVDKTLDILKTIIPGTKADILIAKTAAEEKTPGNSSYLEDRVAFLEQAVQELGQMITGGGPVNEEMIPQQMPPEQAVPQDRMEAMQQQMPPEQMAMMQQQMPPEQMAMMQQQMPPSPEEMNASMQQQAEANLPKEVLEVEILSAMAKNKDLSTIIQTNLPILENTIDKIIRTLLIMWMSQDILLEKISMDRFKDIENGFRQALNTLSDLTLNLEKTLFVSK
jgi:hypothetical protein